jgi:hypothetical protein
MQAWSSDERVTCHLTGTIDAVSDTRASVGEQASQQCTKVSDGIPLSICSLDGEQSEAEI